MQRHNACKGHNSLQLLFKIYYSFLAACLYLRGFTVSVGVYPFACACGFICDDNAEVTSDLPALSRADFEKHI